MTFWKRQFPAIVVFVIGMLMVIQYYIPHPAASWVLGESNRWVRIVQNCALLLGVASLVGNHWRKIARKQSGYGYSGVVLIFFVLMVLFGLFSGIDAPQESNATVTIPAEVAREGGTFQTEVDLKEDFGVKLTPAPGKPLPRANLAAQVAGGKETLPLSDKDLAWFSGEGGKIEIVAPQGAAEEPLTFVLSMKERTSMGFWMFRTFKVSMESTMYSMLAFFISSAAFRAFRARSVDATVMLVAAIIMMIGRVSFGEMISMLFSEEWLFFPKAALWLLDVPVMAAKRAIFLGIALSVIALSIRIIFGLERSYLGRGE